MTYTRNSPQSRALVETGLAFHRVGDFERATEAYRRALAVAPDDGHALNLLGTALLQLGTASDAHPYLERAARVLRDNPGVLANLAQCCLELGRFEEAREAFRKASRLDPREVNFQIGAASALALGGKLDEAQTLLQRLATRFPRTALVWYNMGNVLRDRRRANEALQAYRKALALDPQLVDARNNLGSVLHSLQRFAEAESEYRACLELAPQHGLARYNLASVVIDVGRFAEAEAICRALVAAEPHVARAHSFLAAALGHQGRMLEALACNREAARLAPDDVKVAESCGAGLMECGLTGEGLRLLVAALARTAEPVAVHQLLSTALLGAGCLQDGWSEYEWRPAAIRFREKYPALSLARSLPEDLSERRVCVLREQGLGDELFLLRYAPVLAKRGARITYRASDKIASLLARVPCIAEIAGETAPLPPAVANIMVGDLPHALGHTPSTPLPRFDGARAPALRDFNYRVSVFWPPPPQSLRIDPLPERIALVRSRLEACGDPPYIGVTWRAGTVPEQQTSQSWLLYKAVALPALAGAMSGARGTVLALQRMPAAGEIEAFARALGRTVHDFSALNEDLESMLALLALLDDYVGVSNTNMHLRAAAGRTARVLVPAPAEWRWMQSGRESPWFPGFSIYRQSLQGDWSAALADLRRDLEAKPA